eukprot:610299-Pyramimonas_sp.AAC.1
MPRRSVPAQRTTGSARRKTQAMAKRPGSSIGPPNNVIRPFVVCTLHERTALLFNKLFYVLRTPRGEPTGRPGRAAPVTVRQGDFCSAGGGP